MGASFCTADHGAPPIEIWGFLATSVEEVLIYLEMVDVLITNYSHLLIRVTPPRNFLLLSNCTNYRSVLTVQQNIREWETWIGIQTLLLTKYNFEQMTRFCF